MGPINKVFNSLYINIHRLFVLFLKLFKNKAIIKKGSITESKIFTRRHYDPPFVERSKGFRVTHNNRKETSGRGFRIQRIPRWNKKRHCLLTELVIYHEN